MMPEQTMIPHSTDGMKTARTEERGHHRPSALRAGVVAGGVAFSASLMMSAIHQPVTELDVLYPKPAQAQADGVIDEFSDLLPTHFASMAWAATPVLVELSDIPQFLDFVQRVFPEIHNAEISYVSRQRGNEVAAPVAVVPTTVAAYSQPIPTGGGGGEPAAPAPDTPPGPVLPPWLDPQAWVDFVTPVVASVPTSNLPVQPSMVPPEVASPPLEVQPLPVEPASTAAAESPAAEREPAGTTSAGTDGGSSGTSGGDSAGTSAGGSNASSGDGSDGGSSGGSSGGSGGDSGGGSGGGE